jgi:hypothetical protein
MWSSVLNDGADLGDEGLHLRDRFEDVAHFFDGRQGLFGPLHTEMLADLHSYFSACLVERRDRSPRWSCCVGRRCRQTPIRFHRPLPTTCR